MNKKIVGILATIVVLTGITACNNKNTENNQGGTKPPYSDGSEVIVDNNTYNNGELFVKYKGKTYFREYNNGDIEEAGLLGNYTYQSDVKTSKYINSIADNGKIQNVFEDYGYGKIYILDDRFFLEGYNKIYSVNMKGEGYIDFGKGLYVGCDEENHKIYYKNSNNGMTYSIDTVSLKITKIGEYEVLFIEDNIMYYADTTEKGIIKIGTKNIVTNEEKEVVTITGETSQNYYISDFKKYENKLCVSVGYNDGSMGIYTDSRLCVIDLNTNSLKIVDKNVDTNLKLQEGILYYTLLENIETRKTTLKKIDLKTMEVVVASNVDSSIRIENDMILDKSSAFSYYDDNLNKVEVVSDNDILNFKERYNIPTDDEKYIVEVKNNELVKDKIYYTIELSEEDENYTIGWRTGYKRIATEVYMYDINKKQSKLLYLYKVSDKDEINSGDIYVSGEDIDDSPLAENEMYLEIKLSDKGLKDTFEVRVEEVGGLIIGKRIEYEGTHKRTEGSLKIKVTKEVGAMLTVYIDNKVDSQMVIE